MARDTRIVRDHDDRIFCLFMEFLYEFHDRFGIFLIEIACGLIGEEVWHIRDEGSRDSDTLLLAT